MAADTLIAGAARTARRVHHGAFLYRRLFVQQLKAVLEYQAQFWIMMGAAGLTQGIGYVFIWAIFQHVPVLDGWTMWDVVLMYALVYASEGFVSFFLEGMWRLARRVNQGEIDYYLVRPVSPIMQLVTADLGVQGLGNMVLGGVLIWQAVIRGGATLGPGKLLLALVIVVSAMVVRACISLVANAWVFWTQSPSNVFPFLIHNMADFGKYPITIYGLWVRPIVIAIVPFAFVSFFPAAYLLDRGRWAALALLTPLVAVYCMVMASWVFRRGLRRYESTGN